jgi:hypothetical protein
MRKAAEKNPKALIALGARLAEAKRTLSPDAYDAFRRREPELWHETKPGKLVDDKDRRLIRIASMPVLRDHVDKLPATGWSTLRELPKLGPARASLPHRARRDQSLEHARGCRSAALSQTANIAPRDVGEWKRGARGRRRRT